MKHYGDIAKLNGHELPVVDVITGGSPCQDLSVAGKRAGLAGERSGLFMEQIRIIKEMREHDRTTGRSDEFIRPRYMVWENVPGALSSNGGKDFQAVLTETIRIAKADAPEVPLFGGGSRWDKAGCFMGIGDSGLPFSVAWRVHDAQFWGVPQRRVRIALVADFNGTTAPEILFERKGMRGDLETQRGEGETTSRTAEEGSDGTSYTLKIRGGCERDSGGKRAGKGALVQTELSGTLGVSQDQTLIQVYSLQGNMVDRDTKQNGRGVSEDVAHTLNQTDRHVLAYENHSQDSRYNPMGGVSETVSAKYGTGGNNTPLILEMHRGKR